jgi:hypothetical protein
VTTPSYRIEPLFLPASLDAPDATEFLEFSDLCDAVVLETWATWTGQRPATPGWKRGATTTTRSCGSSSCG